MTRARQPTKTFGVKNARTAKKPFIIFQKIQVVFITMSDTTAVPFLCVIIVECLIIIFGNLFTIFVFWKHRNRLKRTTFLLINLTLVDLLSGLAQLVVIGTFSIQQQFPGNIMSSENIATSIQSAFSLGSLFFLVLISLERVYAVIWPLRHRVAGAKGYICGVTFVWMAGIAVGVSTLLAVYNIIEFVHFAAVLCFIIVVSLITICASYLAIRTRLNCRIPAIDSAHNRQSAPHQKAKLARTLFIMISGSLVCFLPSTVGYLIHHLCSKCLSSPLSFVFNFLYLANSLVNPIIYSFRMPIFRETLKRMKLHKQSKQYRVSYKP